ncbi:aminoglycoside phosphotransferase family protein [Salinactinospora qingdaonensis]|uniref:Aminoglycoside phosphotransferase family protein n=1 Tax=Salinactinospora qingdaonensis TaxID=702744 RepID=A0ABP7GDD9_9ACTN
MGKVITQLVDDPQRERLERRFGSGAQSWLDSLPALLDDLARQWKLTIEGPAPHGKTSVVVRCRREDGAVGLLKTCPEPAILGTEARVLRLWESTRRVPMIWEVDSTRGGLLMEFIEPGHSALDVGKPVAMEDIGALIADLHAADISADQLDELHPLQTRLQFLYNSWEYLRATGPAADVVPPVLLHRGHAHARALAAAEDNVVPLHGDLHPGNVLIGEPERGLVAIDPRACAGDAAFDGIDWVLWQVETVEEIHHRAAVLAPAIGTSTERLLNWCRALAPIPAIDFANRGQTHHPTFAALTDFIER